MFTSILWGGEGETSSQEGVLGGKDDRAGPAHLQVTSLVPDIFTELMGMESNPQEANVAKEKEMKTLHRTKPERPAPCDPTVFATCGMVALRLPLISASSLGKREVGT